MKKYLNVIVLLFCVVGFSTLFGQIAQQNTAQQTTETKVNAVCQRGTVDEVGNQLALIKIVRTSIPEDEEKCIDICLDIVGRLELAKQWLDKKPIDRRHAFGDHIDEFNVAFTNAKYALSNRLYRRAVQKFFIATNEISWIFKNVSIRESVVQSLSECIAQAEKVKSDPLRTCVSADDWKRLDIKLTQCRAFVTQGQFPECQRVLVETTSMLAMIADKYDAETKRVAEKKRIAEEKRIAKEKQMMKERTNPTKAIGGNVEKLCAQLNLVVIPAGTFQMGGHGDRDEKPVHTVTISKPFCLGKYEVTQAQWKKVMGNNPSEFKGDNRPVEKVNWYDAKAFCKKLNQSLKDKLPAGYHFDLPTEAQWEYACRAGSTGHYSGGIIDDVAWYDENSGSQTHEVGKKKPNALGLYDMHGNVLEWCRDWYGKYPHESVTDPAGPSSGTLRVSRGGSWFNYLGHCRSADRISCPPDDRYSCHGFRLALVPIQ